MHSKERRTMPLLATLGIAFFVSCTHKPMPAVEVPFYSDAAGPTYTVRDADIQTPNTFQGLQRGQSWAEANTALKAHGLGKLSRIDYSGASAPDADGTATVSFRGSMVTYDGSESLEGVIFTEFNHAGKLTHVVVNVEPEQPAAKQGFAAEGQDCGNGLKPNSNVDSQQLNFLAGCRYGFSVSATCTITCKDKPVDVRIVPN